MHQGELIVTKPGPKCSLGMPSGKYYVDGILISNNS